MKPPRLLWGVATATLCSGLHGCAGSVPEQVMSTPAPSPPELARADARGPWLYRQAAQRRSYVVEQRALLRVEQDTSSRVDTVTAHAEVAFLALAETGRVVGADDRAGVLVLTISGAASGSLQGEGEQFDQPVRVAGSSTGELSYRINPATGEILSARGSAVLQFTLRSRLRTQRAHQVSEIRIERGS